MTTITVEEGTKEDLRSLKPESLTWDEYFTLVLDSLDPDRLEENLEAWFADEVSDVVARARERYEAAEGDPDRLLDADEARDRVRELQDEN